MVCYHVTGAGGAVVVEEVVAIGHIFWKGIGCQRLHDGSFLRFCEIQHLLSYTAIIVGVFCKKLVNCVCSHAIVGQTEYETGDEIGLVETKNTIIDDNVLTCDAVTTAKGCVAIQTVYLIMWRTGQQTYFHITKLTVLVVVCKTLNACE